MKAAIVLERIKQFLKEAKNLLFITYLCYFLLLEVKETNIFCYGKCGKKEKLNIVPIFGVISCPL